MLPAFLRHDALLTLDIIVVAASIAAVAGLAFRLGEAAARRHPARNSKGQFKGLRSK